MRSTCRSAIFALASLTSALAVSCSDDRAKPGETVKATLEFRRAETEPAEGLAAATVPGHGEVYYLHPTADVTQADVAEARVVAESREPDPVVELVFTPDGSRKMGVLTEEHLGKRFAILLDGKVVSAPVVLARIIGRVQITGKFTKAEAERLVKSINAE